MNNNIITGGLVALGALAGARVLHVRAEGLVLVELVADVTVGGALQGVVARQEQATQGQPGSGYGEGQG